MMEADDEVNPFRQDDEPIDAVDEAAASDSNLAIDDEDLPAITQNLSRSLQRSPLPAANRAFPSPYTPSFPSAPKSEPCCTRDMWLHSGEEVEIQIVDALKTTENSSTAYIVYLIRTGNVEAKRRYSEFESLRNSLVKLYPTLIVPPIPYKQSISDYAVKQTRAKEDATMISRRKRMLQVFLNRIAHHAILSNEHVFHRFLDRDVSWSEVLNSPPLSLLPKNSLKAPAHNPTDNAIPSAYSALPTPSAAQPLRRPDQRFLDSEAFTNKFQKHLSGSLEKVTRRTMKRWADYSHDHSELGAALNGFSLSESGSLANAIEKTGQAVDATYMSTSRLLQEFEQSWYEPLQEYTQFAGIIKKLLIYRHQKHVQYEMTQELLDTKREMLEDLEKNEAEARRLDTALSGANQIIEPRRSGETTAQQPEAESDAEDARQPDDSPFPTGSITRAEPSPQSPVKRRGPGLGFLNALSYSLHGIMDVDPEAARRNSISKTKDHISQLEDALQASAQDLKYASSTIQADLDRFQRQKVADIRDMCISMARIHRDWCKSNLEAWQEAKAAVDKIEPHPNRVRNPTEGGSPIAGPSSSASIRL